MRNYGRIIILLVLLLRYNYLFAQEKQLVSGRIFSDSGVVAAANVLLYQSNNGQIYQPAGFTSSDNNGFFSFLPAKPLAGTFVRIIVSHILYQPDTLDLSPRDSNLYSSLVFRLRYSNEVLKEVIIKNTTIRVSGDTIEYNAEAFKKLDTRKIEDLLKNIEGFSISSSGRITYRGKEIKAVLINGENLTKEQYQILTRNLNADLVDKIQVFDNFNENRIIGSVLQSGAAAVNLELKKELEGKLSGGLSAGSSLKAQHDADGNLVWLKGKVKFINLFNYNSISKEGYKETIGTLDAVSPNPESSFIKNLYKGSGVIFPPSISMPPVSYTYLNRNGDISFSPLLHLRINNTFKLALRYSSIFQLTRLSDESLTDIIINSQNRWEIKNARSLRQKDNLNYLSLVLSHDNQKKFAGELFLQGAVSLARNNYFSLSAGAIADTLSELFKTRINTAGIQYNGAIKITEYSALTLMGSYTVYQEKDLLSALTKRYNDYWQLSEPAHEINQIAKFLPSEWLIRSSLIQRKGKNVFVALLNAYRNSFKQSGNFILAAPHSSTGNAEKVFDMPAITQLKKEGLSIKTTWVHQPTNNFNLRLSAGAGSEKISATGISAGTPDNLVWDLAGTARWKMKNFSSFFMTLSSIKTMPPLYYFIDGIYIQSGGGIYQGTKIIDPINYTKAEIGYNIYKLVSGSSFQINIFGKKSASDYVFGNIIDTAIIITYPLPVRNNWEYGGTISVRTYIFPIKSTISISGNLRKDKGIVPVNNEQTDNRQTNSGYSASYVSKFDFPYNTEIVYSKNLFSNKQYHENSFIQTKTEWSLLTWKSRLQFNSKYYLGTEYNFIKFTGQKNIHLFDLYSTYIFSKKLSADLKLHNLFNIQRFHQVSATANATNTQSVNTIGRYLFCRLTWSF